MGRFHAIRYLCLLVVSLFGTWLLLALVFLFLPALPYDWDAEGPGDLQRIGNAVTRVYTVKDWFPYSQWKSDVQAIRDLQSREFFAIDYQLNSSLDALKTLLILDDETSLDLHAYWDRTDKSPRAPEEGPAYYISEPIYATAKQGDRDGINPQWFRQADACLLFWEIHRETALIPLRLKVFNYQTNSQLIELWPDSIRWNKSDNPSLGVREPLITIHSDDEFIRTIELRFPYDIEIEQSSPSRTFALRRAIQSLLVPTGLFVYNLTGFMAIGFVIVLEVLSIAFQLLAFYSLVVFVFWVANGKPQFGPWSQSHWLTRHVAARLPTHSQNAHTWDHASRSCDDGAASEHCPQPLRGIGDFFRSRSPLDDLFMTFEFTKYMIEPIIFRRSRTDSGERAQVTGVPNDFKFNLSHRTSKHAHAYQQHEQSDLEKGHLQER